MSNEVTTINLDNGKYTIYLHGDTGAMRFLRNGESWPAGQEMFQHAGLVAAMAYRIGELEEAHAGLVELVKKFMNHTHIDSDSYNVVLCDEAREFLVSLGAIK